MQVAKVCTYIHITIVATNIFLKNTNMIEEDLLFLLLIQYVLLQLVFVRYCLEQ